MLITSSFLAHLSQITSIILWTGAIVVTKILTKEFSPFVVVPTQMLIGTILVLLIFFIFKLKVNLKSFISGVIFGLIAPGLAFSFFMYASTKTDAVSMIVFWSLLPLLTPFFGRIVLSEKTSPILYVGLVVAILGTYILIYMRTSQGSSDLIGNILALCGVGCSIIGHIIGRRFNKIHLKPLDMALGQIFGATITSSVILIINITFFGLETNSLLKLKELFFIPEFIYLVIFATSINFILYNFALSKIPVAWVSFYSVFIPPLGAIFSFFLLNEAINEYDSIAIIIIIVGGLIPSIQKLIKQHRYG